MIVQISFWVMVLEGFLLQSILVKYVCLGQCSWIFQCVLDFSLSGLRLGGMNATPLRFAEYLADSVNMLECLQGARE